MFLLVRAQFQPGLMDRFRVRRGGTGQDVGGLWRHVGREQTEGHVVPGFPCRASCRRTAVIRESSQGGVAVAPFLSHRRNNPYLVAVVDVSQEVKP